MPSYKPLVCEYRGELIDLTHQGYICIVDENSNVIFSVGSPDEKVFYRSSSKPIQALPLIARGLDREYGLTEEETAIFAASHAGEKFHIAALESIAEKAGLTEDMWIMKPTVPVSKAANEERIREGKAPRKFYHNCAGKHAALIITQRALGGEIEDYWKLDSKVQQEVLRTVALMSECREEDITVGIDGCGVPVFAVGMKNIAAAFKNLACLDTIKDEGLRRAAETFVPRMNKYSHMIRGTGYLCSIINQDSNIVAKGGAAGVYGCGLKKERLGISMKLADGCEDVWPFILSEIFKAIGYENGETIEKLDALHGPNIYNDNDTLVGHWEPMFKVEIKR